MTKLDAALALAARGFKVFPIKAGAKYPPLWKAWNLRAKAEVPEDWPAAANVAIHCEGMVVLDVDARRGGLISLAKLDLAHGLPPTLTTLTPTGGMHVFYRLPEGHSGVPNSTDKIAPGIDIKSTNGYVVAPGSEVPAGRYRFAADMPIADAPDWLVAELGTIVPKTRTATVAVPDAPEDIVERATEWFTQRPIGDGNSYTNACGLRDFGLSLDQALAVFGARDSRPDALAQVEHAYRYAQNEPGSKAASAEDFPIIEEPALKAPRNRPMRLNEIAKLPTATTGYLIKGMLQRKSHAVLYGRPGAGKTFVALDMAYHVAAGKEWQNQKVHPGLVLYMAYEGLGGMAKRAAAIVQQENQPDVPLYIVGADYNLRDPAGRRALGEDIASLPEKPVLVVIDTLARAMKGGDENSAQDMGALNDAVGALIEATGACVLLIHHSGKNRTAGARGSSALLGAIDTELEVDSFQIFSRKQRDLELASPLGFKLLPVMIGVDEDGAEVSSCIVVPAKPIVDTIRGLPEQQRLAFEILVTMAPDNKPVPVDAWRGKCVEILPQNDSSARKAFVRIKHALIKKHIIECSDDGYVQRTMT